LLAGVLLAGIRVSVPEAILVIAVLWATMLPMALLGLVIGLALRPSAVQPVATIGMMLLAVAGGLWFPVDMFPGWLQDLSALLPTHWMGVLGQWVITGEGAVGRGVITLAIWSVVLAVAAALLLGRAARTAPRR
ncbi:MAG: hypothetical protein Q4G40_10310, partial [Brachybacterium sp.]|nr:hypothetical protein [Brachybacterium sp.]